VVQGGIRRCSANGVGPKSMGTPAKVNLAVRDYDGFLWVQPKSPIREKTAGLIVGGGHDFQAAENSARTVSRGTNKGFPNQTGLGPPR